MNAVACSADKSPDLRTYLRRAFDIDELDEGETIAIVTAGEYDGKTVYPAVSGTDKRLKSMARSKNTKATYFCVSTVQAVEAGKKLGRGKADCRTAYVVALDDIGNTEKVASVPPVEPSAKLETSAGNFQWHYFINPYDVSTPDGLAHYEGCLEALAAAKLTDPGALGAHRIMRMPGSVNTKPGLDSFETRVTEWHPDRVWDLDGLMEGFGLEPKPKSEHVKTTGTAPPPPDMNDVLDALKHIDPNCSRDTWRNIGMALKTVTDNVTLWDQWSTGELGGIDQPGSYDQGDIYKQWPGFKPDGGITIATLFYEAIEAGWKPPAGLDTAAAFGFTAGPASDKITLADFLAHKPDHKYIFIPTRDLWPAISVDSSIEWPGGPDGKMKPSRWLDANRHVEQMTWAPGLPLLIENKLIDTGGWIDHYGCTCFNLYRPPTLQHGDASQAGPWLQHLKNVYPDDVEHITRWLAHRVQHPEQKLNHALVLGGRHGIGKDTILEPVKMAVGPWNCHEVSPGAMLGRFNNFVKSVILRVSEARDLGDVDRFSFYDHTKAWIAAPPDVIRVDEKNVKEYPIPNLCGVVITTNHKSDGLYLPADDRRHYVAWSDLSREQFDAQYWNRLYQWYDAGGTGHVAAYLSKLDLSGFDPKAPPAKTEAFWHIVNAARPPEESELADILDSLGNPDAVTLDSIKSQAQVDHPEFGWWLADRRHRRQIPHRLESAGYESVRNPAAKEGQWSINGKRQTVYAKTTLSVSQRHAAANRLSQCST